MPDVELFEVLPAGELAEALQEYRSLGGVIDHIYLTPALGGPAEERHRRAALAGMRALQRRYQEWAANHATPEHPAEKFFGLHWDETQMKCRRVSFVEFWGTDDALPKSDDGRSWIIPNIDGYKTAFFNPPYDMGGSETFQKRDDLLNRIIRLTFGKHAANADIFSWSTDWSNYFEAGLDWWGAFYWTVHPADSSLPWAVIGASTTD